MLIYSLIKKKKTIKRKTKHNEMRTYSKWANSIYFASSYEFVSDTYVRATSEIEKIS